MFNPHTYHQQTLHFQAAFVFRHIVQATCENQITSSQGLGRRCVPAFAAVRWDGKDAP
jgi:hypothetical protein